MSELLELAARCEAAEGPDCDLDHAIHDLLGDNDGAPLYTRSLDAAMTLVPEGWGARLLVPLNRGKTDVELFADPQGHGPMLRRHGFAATPALALCAAALRTQGDQ